MSFTQEKRTNITSDQAPVRFSPVSYCDGCDARCELGYEYGHGLNYYIYPTIGGRPMFSYIDKDCMFQPTSVFVKEPRTPSQVYQQELCAKLLAGKIARLCDHYKTR